MFTNLLILELVIFILLWQRKHGKQKSWIFIRFYDCQRSLLSYLIHLLDQRPLVTLIVQGHPFLSMQSFPPLLEPSVSTSFFLFFKAD